MFADLSDVLYQRVIQKSLDLSFEIVFVRGIDLRRRALQHPRLEPHRRVHRLQPARERNASDEPAAIVCDLGVVSDGRES